MIRAVRYAIFNEVAVVLPLGNPLWLHLPPDFARAIAGVIELQLICLGPYAETQRSNGLYSLFFSLFLKEKIETEKKSRKKFLKNKDFVFLFASVHAGNRGGLTRLVACAICKQILHLQVFHYPLSCICPGY
jgi:hypothetical protein